MSGFAIKEQYGTSLCRLRVASQKRGFARATRSKLRRFATSKFAGILPRGTPRCAAACVGTSLCQGVVRL